MYIDFNKKIGFLCHPKTGTQTVSTVLRDYLGFKHVGGHHCGPHNLCQDLMGPWVPKWNNLPMEEKEQYQWFCTVRNPYDLIVTWWSSKRMQEIFWQGIDGRCVMEIIAHRPQWYPYSGNLFRFLRDPLPGQTPTIIKLENLERDTIAHLVSKGYDEKDIPRFPHKGRHPYKRRGEPLSYWLQKGLNYFNKQYRTEIESLGYAVMETLT